MSAVANVLRESREAAGLKQADVARALGVSRSAVANWELARARPSMANFRRIVEMYGVPPTRLLEAALADDDEQLSEMAALESGRPRDAAANDATPPAGAFALNKPNVVDASPLVSKASMPLFRSAEGGPSGSQIDFGEAIDYVKRPDFLSHVQKAFAVYVVGDSMEPAYEQGDMVLIHPDRPVSAGQDVLVVKPSEDGTASALIKRLVRRDDNYFELMEYSPERRTFRVERSEWPHAYPIVGKYHRR